MTQSAAVGCPNLASGDSSSLQDVQEFGKRARERFRGDRTDRFRSVPLDDASDRTSLAHNMVANRYELSVDGEVASFAEYFDDGDVVVFPHTVTAPRFRGNGFAERVVRFALDDVRQRGKHVVASCWFVAEFIAEHPEYGDQASLRPTRQHDDDQHNDDQHNDD